MLLRLLLLERLLFKRDSVKVVEGQIGDNFFNRVISCYEAILLNQVRVRQIIPIADRQLLVLCDRTQALQRHETLLGQFIVEGDHDAVWLPAVVEHVKQWYDHAHGIRIRHLGLVFIVEDKRSR